MRIFEPGELRRVGSRGLYAFETATCRSPGAHKFAPGNVVILIEEYYCEDLGCQCWMVLTHLGVKFVELNELFKHTWRVL